jgi:hypothetical protein
MSSSVWLLLGCSHFVGFKNNSALGLPYKKKKKNKLYIPMSMGMKIFTFYLKRTHRYLPPFATDGQDAAASLMVALE